MDRLKGKVILISGGARGQGAAEARLFVAERAQVVIGDVLEAEARQLASELGPSAAFVRHDVTQERDWETAIKVAENFGGLHGLVNNAGIYQPRTLTETDTELFERHMRVNQLGCFLGMKAVVMLISDPYKELMPEVNDAKDLGSGVIHGVECDHLAFRTKEVDWQIWIAQGARPYPCRYVITSKKVAGWPQYTLDTWGWKTGAEVASDSFKLEIPPGAKKLTPDEVPELNDIPGLFSMAKGAK